MTGEEWDTRYWVIFNDLCAQGEDANDAFSVADRECTEQFGERPQEETT